MICGTWNATLLHMLVNALWRLNHFQDFRRDLWHQQEPLDTTSHDRRHEDILTLFSDSRLRATLWSEPHNFHEFLLDGRPKDIHHTLSSETRARMCSCVAIRMTSAMSSETCGTGTSSTMCSTMRSGMIGGTSTTSSTTCGIGNVERIQDLCRHLWHWHIHDDVFHHRLRNPLVGDGQGHLRIASLLGRHRLLSP